MINSNYAVTRQFNGDFEEAVGKIKSSLKDQGFGVLIEIDVRQTLSQKLGIDFDKYLILGACNPANAYKALQAEIEIGLLLPCNLIVFEKAGNVYISTIKPSQALTLSSNPVFKTIAQEVENKLIQALEEAVN